VLLDHPRRAVVHAQLYDVATAGLLASGSLRLPAVEPFGSRITSGPPEAAASASGVIVSIDCTLPQVGQSFAARRNGLSPRALAAAAALETVNENSPAGLAPVRASGRCP